MTVGGVLLTIVAVLLVVGAIAFVVVAVLVALRRPSPERVTQSHVRRRCLVTLKDGRSFFGVLWDADERVMVLREATVAETNDAVDGELLLQRSDVAFMQLP